MANRYGDRDYDRDQQNYGRRSNADYDRSVGERYGYGRDENERERYDVESRWRGQAGSSSSAGSAGNYRAGREEYGASRGENDRDYTGGGERDRGYGERDRGYGGYGRGSNATQRYDGPSSYSQQQGNQSGSRYGQSYGGARGYDYDRSGHDYGQGQGQGRSSYDYGQGQGRSNYDYGQGRSGSRQGNEDRGWWDRASDAVASWFGDDEAERRRHMDEQRQYRGRGPKGYRRSDDRIKEDINDRLSEGYLDASDIEVAVQNGEVSLTGTVNNRNDKRRAEDIAEYVTGVTHVENRIRVKRSDLDRYTGTEGTGTMGSMGTAGTTGATGATGSTGPTDATGTSASSSAATGTTSTARGKTAGS